MNMRRKHGREFPEEPSGAILRGAALEYRLINENCYWVDDPDSPLYDQWVESEDVTWKSAEHLIDHQVSHKYSVVIGYNRDPVQCQQLNVVGRSKIF